MGRYGRRWWRRRDRLGARGLDEARRRRWRRSHLERRSNARRVEARTREVVVDTRHVRIHTSPEAVQQRFPGTAQGGGALVDAETGEEGGLRRERRDLQARIARSLAEGAEVDVRGKVGLTGKLERIGIGMAALSQTWKSAPALTPAVGLTVTVYAAANGLLHPLAEAMME